MQAMARQDEWRATLAEPTFVFDFFAGGSLAGAVRCFVNTLAGGAASNATNAADCSA
jgi:hypothetical protein